MARRGPGINDVWIEHSGKKVGYKLARDENGVVQFSAGLVEQQAPQRVTEGFGYPALPAHVNVSIILNDWSGGAGELQAPAGSQTTNRYSYTRNIDLSEPGRMYLSPLRQASTDIGDTVRKFKFTSLGLYAITDTEIWIYNTTTDVWDQEVASVTPTDIQEFEGNVYFAMGTNAYRYTADAATYTTSTAAFKTFERFTLRSGQSGGAILWGVDANGDLRLNQNPVNGGDAWSASNVVGDTWETVTALISAEDFLYLFKEEGIYAYDGTTIEDVFPAQALADTDNGRHSFLWQNGMIYTNYGDRLWEFDPGSRAFRSIWVAEDREGHPELNGTITAIGGDATDLYFAIKNAAGNSYIMKGDPDTGSFHTFLYLGANDCTALSLQRAAAVHASNPVLVAAYGQFASWYILAGPGLRPEDDASYQFESSGTAYWGWLDGGAALYSKFITAGRLVTENTLEIGGLVKTLDLAYSLDGSPIETELTSSITPGITVGVPPQSVRFTWVRPKVTINTSDNSESPIGKGIVLDTTPNPPRRRAWDMILDFGDATMPVGALTRYTGYDPIDHLFAGTSAEILFYDRRSRRWITKMENIKQVHLESESQQDAEMYQVRMFEMGAQGYLSIWYGIGNKFLLPDLPGGAVGLNDEDPNTGNTTSIFYPENEADHRHWIVGDNTHSYIRFKNVTIPQGATIVSAKVRLRLFAATAGDVDVDQYFEDADTGTAPTTSAGAEALTLTTATSRHQVTVSGADAWWTWFEFSDITAPLQEIIDRAGWEAGSDATYVGRQRDLSSGTVWTKWFDTVIFSLSTQETVPELVVEWTA
jgi:hypothetical protein